MLAVTFNLIKFDYSLIKPRVINKKYLKKIWSFSWPQLIGFSGLYVIQYIDLYVIKHFMTLHDVGVYSVAYKGFEIIIGLLLILNTIFFPLIVEYRTTKKYHLIISYLKKIPLYTFFWGFFVLIGIFLSHYLIPGFFGLKYTEAIPVFNILLFGTLFYIVYIFTMPIINAFDLVLYFQISNIIIAVVNIILDFILVPNFGLSGAAIATSLTFGLAMGNTLIIIFMNKKFIINKQM